MRGEYYVACVFDLHEPGSSPHAWRIYDFELVPLISKRFIPTCVENMMYLRSIGGVMTVHPHMRGEYLVGRRTKRPPCGSSPHAWRICRQSLRPPADWRFIPTCVENITARRFDLRPISVHPHMRGEYPNHLGVFVVIHGSSPHAWRIL